jgi:hypothetical protein
MALLSEWKLEDEAERLAENGVCEMEDLEFMKEEDVPKFGLLLKFRGLLEHVAKQKKKRLSDGSKEKKAKPSPAAAPPNKKQKKNMPVEEKAAKVAAAAEEARPVIV